MLYSKHKAKKYEIDNPKHKRSEQMMQAKEEQKKVWTDPEVVELEMKSAESGIYVATVENTSPTTPTYASS